jgi:hypothetical protein
MIVRALGISMGTHERTEEAKQSSTSGANARIDLADMNGAPAFDSAQVLIERSGETKNEAVKAELTGIAGTETAPEAEECQSSEQGYESEDDTPQTEAQSASGRVNRFSLLAACLALAAALGGMVGALAAYTLARPVAPSAVVATGIGSEELQILKENVVQARVDLAALKASVDGGNRNGNAQLSKLTERIERMERNQTEPVARLSKAAENLERIARAETTGSIVPPQPIGPRPPGEGWVLREVRRGTAILDGRTGTIEVDPGDIVPGMGRVEDIRKQDGRWIVVTAKGVISARR